MFKVNDYVVYKKDVCQISEIKEKYFNDTDYYILRPVSDKSLTISVPTDNKVIRNLISKKELEAIIQNIPNIKLIESTNKLIENDYKELMATGKHEDLIQIIKTTYLRNKERSDNNKKIGDKDDNYFKLAEKLLYTEFMIVLGMSYDEAKEYVVDKVANIK